MVLLIFTLCSVAGTLAHPATGFRYEKSTIVYNVFPYVCLIQNVHVEYTDQLSVQVDHESYLEGSKSGCAFALNAFGCIVRIKIRS